MQQSLPPGYAVIGIIGPDDPRMRKALRAWTMPVQPAVLARFAVSVRDRAASPWWNSAAAAVEADVDFLDCLGQRSGASVVIISLFDAWLRHAVSHYPHAAFIGRADADAIPNPQWLLAMLAAEATRQATELAPSSHVYIGSMQW